MVSIIEPHPSVLTPRYLPSGRGGAGNQHYYTPNELTNGQTATGPASKISLTRRQSSPLEEKLPSSRGGAGNITRHSRREDDLASRELSSRERSRDASPYVLFGRGGAANVIAPKYEREREGRFGETGSVSSKGSRGSAGS
ncbi:hypothetical protein K470DRAFT_238326, partial [Piedraia hortae CBS 480.64]